MPTRARKPAPAAETLPALPGKEVKLVDEGDAEPLADAVPIGATEVPFADGYGAAETGATTELELYGTGTTGALVEVTSDV